MNLRLLILLSLQAVLLTAQDESDDLVISVEELVKMYNEEEEAASSLVRRRPKLVASQDTVDFNSVVGVTRSWVWAEDLMIMSRRCRAEEMCGEGRAGAGDGVD